ncbi:MAG: hypothetical protein ACI952_002310 [Flavobacteriales bacterium]|jgi:hypothetical protein
MLLCCHNNVINQTYLAKRAVSLIDKLTIKTIITASNNGSLILAFEADFHLAQQ